MFLLVPFVVRSALFVAGGLKQLLPNRAPRLYGMVSKYLDLLVSKYSYLYSMNALLEVMAGFVLVLNLFTPARNLMLLFGYWQYLRIRFMLSEESKRAWGQVRARVDGWMAYTMVPAAVKGLYEKLKETMHQYTDQELMAQQAAQPGLMSKCTIM